MLLKRLNREEPERVFVVVLNDEGAQIVKDAAVALDLGTDAADGIKARDMDTGELYAFVGLADAAINDGDYGLVQVYGYRSTSVMFQTDTSQAAGVPIIPTAGQHYMQSFDSLLTRASIASSDSLAATTYTLSPVFGALMESIASSSASATISAKVFLRAL